MRGVAALFVVARHVGPYVPRFSYLAVDLFFVLSGFVLALQNDGRFAGGMSARTFLAARVRRLYPLYALGLALGVISALVADPEHLGWRRTLASAATEAVGLPAFANLHGASPFPINGVLWSIFFEFWVANLVFAMFWRQLHSWRLAALIGVCAAALIVTEKLFYSIDVGWTWKTFPFGFARVGFSFFAGVALVRLHRLCPPTLRIPSWLPVAVLCAVLALPLRERAAHAFELALVIVGFPALIFWGAEAHERNPAMGRALGDASYAVYTIHRPLIELTLFAFAAAGLATHTRWAPAAALCFQASFIVVCAFLAWWLDRFFDVPVRARLKARKTARAPIAVA